ncbi:MAG: hypothetical protein O7G87_07715 [bacterium]|nr:hypothetical protein [bacterium]
MADRIKIAAVVTAYYPRSHADVIVTKFLKGFPTDEGFQEPRVDLVSMYLDQIAEKDIGVKLAEEHGIPIFPSIPGALTLGGKDLAVDGVLLIGEHGDYAWNEKEQHLYPRRFFFEQICGMFATSGRSVPVYSDKHLSYNWTDAKWMYDRAKALNVPFMAGSSAPLVWRSPWLEYDLETPLEEAISIGHGGLESYGFHALEVLQCMVERRVGGETGIQAVQCLEGDDVWKARDEKRWSQALAEAACGAIQEKAEGKMEVLCENPAVFLIEYSDGLKGAMLMLNGYVRERGFAGRVAGRVQGTRISNLRTEPHSHFSYLGLNIQEMFLTHKPQYPVERTLLISGALEALMDSRYRGHVRVETPHLDVSYQSYEKLPIRPRGPKPSGASLIPL